MNTRTIQGVRFSAVRLESRFGHTYWKAKIEATGRILEQDYHTRPAMWEDLEHCARLCGPRFATDSLAQSRFTRNNTPTRAARAAQK